MKKLTWKKIGYEAKCTFIMLCAVVVSCFSLHIFVIPSDFAPSGIDGISMILYELTGLNIGWFKLILNLPLLILALIFLNKRYVIYIALYTILDSLGVILLEHVNFYTFIPTGLEPAQEIGYRLIASIFSGVALGITSGLMLKMGFSTGGVDIIASLIHKKKPHVHIEKIISAICYLVILLSYFVYWDVTSILLSVIQIFVFEMTASAMLRGDRYAVEATIITKHPDIIKDVILNKFEHSATILSGEGMYSGDDLKVVVTVMTESELEDFRNIIKKYPDTFVYYMSGVRVQGDFQFNEHNIRV